MAQAIDAFYRTFTCRFCQAEWSLREPVEGEVRCPCCGKLVPEEDD